MLSGRYRMFWGCSVADNYWPVVVLLSLLFAVALLVGGFGVFLLLGERFLSGRAERGLGSKTGQADRVLASFEKLQDRLRGWGITILRVVTGLLFIMSGGQKLSVGGFDTTVQALGQLHGGSLP